jgi:hypothetical protein
MHNVQIRAYCLMPNRVDLIAVPKTKDGLNLAIQEAATWSCAGKSRAARYFATESLPLERCAALSGAGRPDDWRVCCSLRQKVNLFRRRLASIDLVGNDQYNVVELRGIQPLVSVAGNTKG